MRIRNKHRKSSALRCNAGRCSLSALVWGLVGCILLIHFYSLVRHNEGKETQVRLNHFPLARELEEVEEENFQIQPRGKRSPRAAKRRAGRKPSLIDEFLDDSSQIRLLFFPDHKTAIGPTKSLGNDSMYFYPGRQWLDTEGNLIQAHGGGILYDERTELYYWYGENKDGPTFHAHKKGAARANRLSTYMFEEEMDYIGRVTLKLSKCISIRIEKGNEQGCGFASKVDIIGVSCYSSKDLWTWYHEGIVLPGEEKNTSHDLYRSNVLERPKVIYNDRTGQYVMWMHIDDVNYTKAAVGVAVSDSPTGPFEYLYSKQPHGFDSRDMTIFKDDDGKAYLIYSSEDNSELHVGPLTYDYLDVTRVMRRILVGQHREAPALFKHQGTYYMITSGCTGWAPNEALAHAAESIMGPWETMGNPCIGGNKVFRSTTFFSQSTFVLPLPGIPDSFIFMADRWNPADLRDSRYVWLPLSVGGAADEPLEYNFGFPLWSRVSIYWHKRWRLPDGWKRA